MWEPVWVNRKTCTSLTTDVKECAFFPYVAKYFQFMLIYNSATEFINENSFGMITEWCSRFQRQISLVQHQNTDNLLLHVCNSNLLLSAK